mgnify:FL=1
MAVGTPKSKVFEFRGIDKVMYAKLLTDNDEGITWETPKELAPIAELSKEVETSSESHYYNNQPLISLTSQGADTLTLSLSAIPLEVLADITGRYFDEATGAMSENSGTAPDIALLYRTKGTDGFYRYVVRYKCKCTIRSETVATEDDGTDANGQEIEIIGINTVHEFTKGGSAKALVVDERYGNADLAEFFTEVKTIDSITTKGA